MACRFEKTFRHGKERYEPPANYRSLVLVEFCSTQETDAAAQAHAPPPPLKVDEKVNGTTRSRKRPRLRR